MVVHPASHRVPRALWYSGFLPILHSFVYEGLTLFAVPSQILPLKFQTCCRSTTPKNRSPLVWALPVSLAATQGISLDFFSSDYLDVSVHRVFSPYLEDKVTGRYSRRVAPFGNPWINAYLQLTTAYRSLSRPSSFRNA